MSEGVLSKVSTINDEFDITFDFVRFIKFLKENNIISTAIAAVLSDRINEVTNSLVNNLIMPIINRDGDNDGEKDIKKLEEKVITISGVRFQIGRFIMALIKFILVTYIIFIVTRVVNKIMK